MPERSRLVFGFMTGTSIDALDACAVNLEGSGLGMRARVVASSSVPLGAMMPCVRALASGEGRTAAQIARLALDFAALHIEALRDLRKQAGAPTLLAVHGQTVFHAPPASWQLLNPWPIAREAACPLVFDMRGADLAAGGQGAPITPLADWILFRHDRETRAIVNLGGYCNATILPSGAGPELVSGLDVCACNHLLDGVARRALNQPYDKDGAAASSGKVSAQASGELATILAAQSHSSRSLGSGDEAAHWIDAWLPRLAPTDLAATAVDALAKTIAASLARANPTHVFCAGGGVRNLALLNALTRSFSAPVETTERLGVPIEQREAAEIAILGALCEDRVPITLPGVTRLPTGAGVPGAPIAGAWVFPSGVPSH